jgi:hypothetical protein
MVGEYPADLVKVEPHVKIEAQGRLLYVTSHGGGGEPYRGNRGKVQTFSVGSRMRLLRRFARLEVVEGDGYRSKVSFLTLTTLAHLHPRVIKKFSQRLFKRISRKYPSLSVVWRLEFQKRGAPHLHCVLFNAPWVDRTWIVASWGELVGQVNPVVDIRRVKSSRQLVSYVSKYVAKIGDSSLLDIGTKNAGDFGRWNGMETSVGRIWGVWNAESLPYADLETTVVPLDGSWWMIRGYCRKFFEFISEEDMAGFTVFTDDPYHCLRHIEKLARTFGEFSIKV